MFWCSFTNYNNSDYDLLKLLIRDHAIAKSPKVPLTLANLSLILILFFSNVI